MFSLFTLFVLGLVPSVAVAEHLPVFALRCDTALGPCNNACFAVNHGFHLGQLTKSGPHRVENHKKSGCTDSPCRRTRFGDSGSACTAYPFPATLEGGSGSILRCVEPDQVQAQLDQLGKFYEGKKDGTRYQLAVAYYRGAAYCRTGLKKANGSEFRRVGSKFVAAPNYPAKMRSDNTKDNAMVSNSTTSRRFLKAQNGEVIMLLSDGEGENFVGRNVFIEGEGEVPIVEELPHEPNFDDEDVD